MGGGSSSHSTTSVKTKSIVEAMSKAIMNCKGNTSLVQRFVVSGDYTVINGFKMVQNFKLSSACANSVQNLSDIQQKVSGAIKAQAEAQSVSMLGALGKSSSEVDVNIDNEVRQVISSENVTNIINTVNALQEAIISGDHNIVNDFSMEQTMDIVNTASQDVLNQLKSVQTIANSTDTSAKSTQTNFVSDIIDSVGSIFTSLGSMWTIVVIACILVGGYIVVNGGPLASLMGGPSAPGMPMMRPPMGNMQRPPMGNMQRPPMSGPPPMGQQAPPMGQQAPPMGQQAPMYQQPPMYQQAPMGQQAQQPPMGGQLPAYQQPPMTQLRASY